MIRDEASGQQGLLPMKTIHPEHVKGRISTSRVAAIQYTPDITVSKATVGSKSLNCKSITTNQTLAVIISMVKSSDEKFSYHFSPRRS